MSDSKTPRVPVKTKIGALFQPKNLLKTVGSQIPFASAGVEVLNQWEGVETEARICNVETEVDALKKLQEAEKSVPAALPPQPSEWPHAVGEFMRRNVEVVVVCFLPERPTSEFLIPVGHGCAIGGGLVLSSEHTMDLAKAVAKQKRGRITIMHGLVNWYDFSIEFEDERDGSGLVLCKLGRRDEEKWQDAKQHFSIPGNDDWFQPPPQQLIKTTLKPWTGQEVGWLVSSEAPDIMRGPEMSGLEFQCSNIAHFRKPSDKALKSFVTGVMTCPLPSAGSAVFSKDATLLGVVARIDKYQHDRGHRVIVNGLLGHPYFMNLHLTNSRREN